MDFSFNLSVIFRNFVVARHRIKVTISIEVEFNDEEVAKIRQLVKDSTGDNGASHLPLLSFKSGSIKTNTPTFFAS